MIEQAPNQEQPNGIGRFPEQVGMSADEAASARGINPEHLRSYDISDTAARGVALRSMGEDIMRDSDTPLDKARMKVLQKIGLRNDRGGYGRFPRSIEDINDHISAKTGADNYMEEFTSPSIITPKHRPPIERPVAPMQKSSVPQPENVQRLPYSDKEAIDRGRWADQEMIDRISEPV